MALVGDDLYVANTDAVVRFPTARGQTQITAPGVKVADLPGGPLNHHWTKSLVASPDGTRLYVDGRLQQQRRRERHGRRRRPRRDLEIDPASGATRVFASGLRNPIGMAWQPQTGALWTVVNERDELGSDLVPDYLTSVQDGGFYGWPYSYFGQHVDTASSRSAGPGRAGDRARLRARQSRRAARAWRSPTAARCRSATRTAPSSASTARGTASRAAATR